MRNVLFILLTTAASSLAATRNTADCKGPVVHVYEHDRSNCENDHDQPYWHYHERYETSRGSSGYPYESNCKNIDSSMTGAHSLTYTTGGDDLSHCKLHVYENKNCGGHVERYPLSGIGGFSECIDQDWKSAKVRCTS